MSATSLLAVLIKADTVVVMELNALVRRSSVLQRGTSLLAQRLASVEVLLMLALGLSGRRRSAVRMVLAVCLVYAGSEALGSVWPRARPFAGRADVQALAPHAPDRSFPSRHVASGLAMAAIGGREHPRLGTSMALVAWLLGATRVAAALHYPSDVLAGAWLGMLVGAVLRAQCGSSKRNATVLANPDQTVPDEAVDHTARSGD